MISFDEARQKARSLQLEDISDWFREAPNLRKHGLPENPHVVYANNGFIDYADFLGLCTFDVVNRPPLEIDANKLKFYTRVFPEKHDTSKRVGTVGKSASGLSFDEAKVYIQKYRIENKEQFLSHVRSRPIPEGFPRRPDLKYAGSGWTTWADFLGTDTQRVTSNLLSFSDAKAIATSLNLKTREQWQTYIKENGKPHPLMPYEPQIRFKNNGWISWKDFLGVV